MGAFVECHTLKHSWRADTIAPEADGTRIVTLVCERCGTERIDPIDGKGIVRRRRYRYVVGYLLPKGTERPTAPEYRLEWLADELNRITKKGRKK